VKAAILHGREKIQIEDVAPPALKPGEVRIRIEAALTCGTDLKVFKRGYHAKMIVPPAVFGHELAGVVSEVVRRWSPLTLKDRERVPRTS
jgi:L-iditol 2-dehydrogenase